MPAYCCACDYRTNQKHTPRLATYSKRHVTTILEPQHGVVMQYHGYGRNNNVTVVPHSVYKFL